MKLVRLTGLSAVIAAVFIASFNVAPAEARTICKGSGANAKCYTVKAKKKKFAKRAKVRATVARQRRVAGLRNPWHGWGGVLSFGWLPLSRRKPFGARVLLQQLRRRLPSDSLLGSERSQRALSSCFTRSRGAGPASAATLLHGLMLAQPCFCSTIRRTRLMA